MEGGQGGERERGSESGREGGREGKIRGISSCGCQCARAGAGVEDPDCQRWDSNPGTPPIPSDLNTRLYRAGYGRERP